MASAKTHEGINLLKGISCIIVIFLHCTFPGILGEGIIYALRFPVPIFFMVSGYFSYYREEQWILSKMKSTFKMIFWTEIFYGIWGILSNFPQTYERFISAVQSPIKTLFCGTIFNGTLWYLYSIFWTWFLLYILRKITSGDKYYLLIPLLLIIQIFGRLYFQNVYNINENIFLFRNAIIFGLPYTLIGSSIAEYEKKIFSEYKELIKFLFISGGICMISEYIISRQYMDSHVSTVLISIGLFLTALAHPKVNRKISKQFVYIGEKLSMWIYLIHLFVIEIITIAVEHTKLADYYLAAMLKPILVCIVACFISWLLYIGQKHQHTST